VDKAPVQAWGLENPDRIADWMRSSWDRSHRLGETLRAGDPSQIEAVGSQYHVVIQRHGDRILGVGFGRSQSLEIVHETMKHLVAAWVS
jgi:hypothetical protein